jgi:hypothetical protein
MAAQGLRLTVSLSDFATRKLIAWSRVHDKSKTGFAASIIESAIESNLNLINSLVEDIAENEGISAKALEQRWLEEENYPARKNQDDR